MDVKVYFAKMPAKIGDSPLSCPAREREISEAKSEKAKREKYFAWKLLEYALLQALGLRAKDLRFYKAESGKWLCDQCEFSLSHSKNAVAVAIADAPVGVDIQEITPVSPAVVKKILNETETAAFSHLSEAEKPIFFAKAWTKKESVFKTLNQTGFFTAQGGERLQTETRLVTLDGISHALSVSAERLENVGFFKAETF